MNSSTPIPSVVAASPLPTTNTLIPAGIALAVLTPLTIIIDLPPLIWHIRNRNTAAASLVSWIVLHNFLTFVNILIWPTDNFENRYVGQGLCDVEVKLQVARAVALPAASLCIVRALANVMNTNKSLSVPTKMQRRRVFVMDLVWCFGLPLIMMFLHYIVQPNRYFLAGVSGCTPSFWASWLSIVLLNIPPLLLSLANAYYAGLVLWRLHKYSAAFRNIMASSNTTKSRFLRLFAISFVLAVGLLPVELYVLTTNLPALRAQNDAFSWSAVHNADTWRTIVLYHSVVFYDRWVDVGCGVLVFVFFGLGRDAKKMYCGWLCACGLGKMFPVLRDVAEQRSRDATVQSSYSSRARLNGRSKLASSVPRDTTFEFKDDLDVASPTDSIFQLSKSAPASASTKDVFAFIDEEDQAHRVSASRSMVSRLTAPFKRRSPSPASLRLHHIPISMSKSGHGEIRTHAQGQLNEREILTHKGMLPDKEVLVRKEIRRSSESI